MKSAWNYLVITGIILLKMANFPSLLHHFSNPAHDYFLYRPVYTVIPPFLFFFLCLLSDILTAHKIRSTNYLIYSLFVPLDISAIENFLLTHNFPLSSQLLQLLDPIYFVSSEIPFLALQNHHSNHLPSLNGFWYHHMCMFEQFSKYSSDIILLCGYILVSKDVRLLPLFKNQATFRNYLLFVHNSPYIRLYLVIYACFAYLCHLYGLYNIINTNFLFWTSTLFVGMYIFDIKYCK